jgi:hypothetical protein
MVQKRSGSDNLLEALEKGRLIFCGPKRIRFCVQPQRLPVPTTRGQALPCGRPGRRPVL